VKRFNNIDKTGNENVKKYEFRSYIFTGILFSFYFKNSDSIIEEYFDLIKNFGYLLKKEYKEII